MRLIDGDALENQLCVSNADLLALDEIRHASTVDAEVVVWRKDCKYRTEFGNCGHLRQHGILPVAYPYDFCSYGERKDTDNAT